MYIEKLLTPQQRMHTLLTELRIDPNENVDFHGASCMHGRLEIVHYSYHNKVSIFTDFKIIKIYGAEPSSYDQRRYQNIMAKIFEKEGYREEAKKHKIPASKTHILKQECEDDCIETE